MIEYLLIHLTHIINYFCFFIGTFLYLTCFFIFIFRKYEQLDSQFKEVVTNYEISLINSKGKLKPIHLLILTLCILWVIGKGGPYLILYLACSDLAYKLTMLKLKILINNR